MSIRIPPRWQDMFSGDAIISRIPAHKMEKIIIALAKDGYSFTTSPVPEGYIVQCTKSPHDAMLDRVRKHKGSA
jgi:hypothetical protein